MTTLTNEPFLIPQGRLIKVRVSAKNSLGFGIASILNTQGVVAQYVPQAPSTRPISGNGTSPLQLVVLYPAPEGNMTGGSPITSLNL